MKRNKTLDIIISVIIAIVLWVYVINEINPPQKRTIKQIPVTVTGEDVLRERGLALKGNTVYTVNVDIEGARTDVEHLTAADFTATSDVASLGAGNTTMNVTVTGPKGVTIEDIKDEIISVRVEDYVKENKAVRLILGAVEEGLEMTVLSYPSMAEVCGAKSDVSDVTYVKLELLADAIDLDVLKTVYIQASAIDGGGVPAEGVTLTEEMLPVEAVIYTTKNVQLITNVSGVPLDGEEAYKGIQAGTAITIKGSTDTLASINSIYAETIDITGISRTTSYTLKPVLPEGVYLSKTQGPVVAKVLIEKPVIPEEPIEGETTDSAIEPGTENGTENQAETHTETQTENSN